MVDALRVTLDYMAQRRATGGPKRLFDVTRRTVAWWGTLAPGRKMTAPTPFATAAGPGRLHGKDTVMDLFSGPDLSPPWWFGWALWGVVALSPGVLAWWRYGLVGLGVAWACMATAMSIAIGAVPWWISFIVAASIAAILVLAEKDVPEEDDSLDT